MGPLSQLVNILQVAFGLGFVIFLHELGHFLLAKWNGVKVEKFSIGFGPTLLGFRKGETEYVLAAVPLGGFVKMLGEGPEEEANKTTDPRAYQNKSVGARMAIISAGVIMNLILGLACFAYAYGMGTEEMPAKIGSVMAGAPAYAAGLRPGDEVVAIDGRPGPSFTTLTLKVRLSGQGQKLNFLVKRPGQEGTIPVVLEPRREATADVPSVGVYPADSLTLGRRAFLPPAGLAGEVRPGPDAIQAGDTLTAAAPEGETPAPVADSFQWHKVASAQRDKPLSVVLRRKGGGASGKSGGDAAPTATVTLPPNRFIDFGFRLTPEPVAAVRAGSPAERAGFQKGDTILKVDGRDDFDPMRLPTECYEKAGKPMTFEVSRPDPGGEPRVLSLTATPDDSPPWVEIAIGNEPLDVSGLGLAYHVRTKVQAVRPGSPADKAGVVPGDVINGMVLPPIKGEDEADKPIELTFDDKTPAWPTAFQTVQFRPRQAYRFTVNNGSQPREITPEPVDGWFHPSRGLNFLILREMLPPMGFADAVRRGFDETLDNIQSIYAMFRSLAQSRVSPKNLGGPILIAQAAYSAAGSSLTDLVRFLGILSVNLAVLNFLPIPPLDGGQMVFLIAEKVRGRPLPESALIAGTYVGLLLVLGLMAFVIFQDVSRLVWG